ncbi:hypothetical protein BDZ89DRAFT_1134025 [Hymenopellis radicata]|nr:hypothetical protein BDZ89DRAFT_1134025 [Hymenopellis radicata]
MTNGKISGITLLLGIGILFLAYALHTARTVHLGNRRLYVRDDPPKSTTSASAAPSATGKDPVHASLKEQLRTLLNDKIGDGADERWVTASPIITTPFAGPDVDESNAALVNFVRTPFPESFGDEDEEDNKFACDDGGGDVATKESSVIMSQWFNCTEKRSAFEAKVDVQKKVDEDKARWAQSDEDAGSDKDKNKETDDDDGDKVADSVLTVLKKPLLPSLDHENLNALDTKVLKSAFEDTPNYLSAKALELYIVDQCIVGNLKQSTGDRIHAAFNDLWRRKGFTGDYVEDKATHKFHGNPAQQYEVREMVKSIAKRDKQNGEAAKRDHAEAILVEEIDAVLAASRQLCPDEWIQFAIQGRLTREQTAQCLEHAKMRAFFTSGFTLWTRNFELCQVKKADIVWECRKSNPPFNPYFSVFLENRKGWQNKSDYDCSRESNTYEIHPPPADNEHPALDMYHTVRLWVCLYEYWIGRPLDPDDLLFPQITGNYIIQTKEQMSQNVIQGLITKFTTAAGLTREVLQPIRFDVEELSFVFYGTKLDAAGLCVDTLMKYLLDSLSKYEENYGDALDPGRTDRADIFAGEKDACLPVTNATFTSMANTNHSSHIFALLSFAAAAISAYASVSGVILSSSSFQLSDSDLDADVKPVEHDSR